MIEEEGQNSDLFKRYLYGDLNAAERDQLEDRLFAEAEFTERLEDFENDLVDSYIRGELTVREKAEFENRYLVSESHREKTTVARILHDRMLAETQPQARVVAEPEHGFWTAVVNAWRNRSVALASGLAAAVLVGTLGTWLYFRVSDDHIAKTGNANAIVDTNESTNNPVDDDKSNAVTAQNGDRNDDRPAPEPSPSLSPPTPANEADKRRDQTRVFAFTLLPVTRSSDPPVFEVPRTANTVILTLVHEDQREFRRYQVALLPNGGEATWRRDITAPKRSGSNAVVVSIPASELRPGTYEIGLTGVTHDGLTEDLQFYQFSVRK